MRKNNYKIKYSQNFLKSLKLVEWLVKESSIGPKDIVYEIGPGRGIITEQLAKRCKKVIAIELDRKLYERLKREFKDNPQVEIRFGDFLKCNLPKNKDYKVFSNIPFDITADIVGRLTSKDTSLLDAYLVVQKEAAARFAGRPYGKETQYSLLLKPIFGFQILYHFKRSDFDPKSRVDVVLLRIKRRKKSLVKKNKTQLYKDFIVYGFNQWRADLRKSFLKVFTYRQIKRLSNDLQFPLNSKPTDLSFKQWMRLFEYFVRGVDVDRKFLVIGAEKKQKRRQRDIQKIHRTNRSIGY